MTAFPVSSLVPRQTRITAVLATPQPRLTFTVCIDFQIFEVGRTEVDATLQWEGIVLPGVRDWRALGGGRTIEGGDEVMEGGFCVNSWCRVDHGVIVLGERQGTRFPLAVQATVDFPGFRDLDEDRSLRLEVRAEAEFRGLDLQGSTVRPVPKTLDEARAFVGQHFELEALVDPEPANAAGPSFFFLAHA
jgi:hypothetical protein